VEDEEDVLKTETIYESVDREHFKSTKIIEKNP